MSDKITTGNKGEEEAAKFLVAKGYEIVTRNYRYKHAEVDLIVKKNELLVFVEVKTRSSNSFGEPETFVSEKKAAKVMEGAEQFMFETNWHGNIRFDIVSVKVGTWNEVEHFEDAFY